MIYRFVNEIFTLVRVDFGTPVFNLPSSREDSLYTLGSLSSAGGKTNYFEYPFERKHVERSIIFSIVSVRLPHCYCK